MAPTNTTPRALPYGGPDAFAPMRETVRTDNVHPQNSAAEEAETLATLAMILAVRLEEGRG